MKKTIFTGAATAIITPFKDGEIDYKSFANIVEAQILGGIDAIVVCGTTGEGSTLSDHRNQDLGTVTFFVPDPFLNQPTCSRYWSACWSCVRTLPIL